MDDYQPIGAFRKPHGLKGELRLHVEDAFLDDFLRAEVLFVEWSGKMVPFFIDAIRGRGELIVKLEDVDSREDAQTLHAHEVFLRLQDVSAGMDENREPAPDNLQACTGFRIEDVEAGEIGRIEEILEMPEQLMAIIRREEKELMIPLTPDFIVEKDDREKRLRMDLPEGLLDL